MLAQRVYLSVLGELILSGGRASLKLGVFPSRSVAISGTLEYAEGAIYYDTRDVYRRWQPSAGLSWWITPGFELGWSTALSAPNRCTMIRRA